MDEEKTKFIVKAVVSSGNSPTSFGSLTGILGDLSYYEKNAGFGLIRTIEQNLEDLFFLFTSEITNLMVSAKVDIPIERKKVSRILYRLARLGMLQTDDTIKVINEELQKKKLTYKIPLDLKPKLNQILDVNKNLVHGLHNLYLLEKSEKVEEISKFTKKYLVLSLAQLDQSILDLQTAFQKILDNATETDKMREIGTEILTKLGHLKISVEYMDPLEIATIIYQEQLAAEGVKNTYNFTKKKDLTINEIKDGIARILAIKSEQS